MLALLCNLSTASQLCAACSEIWMTDHDYLVTSETDLCTNPTTKSCPDDLVCSTYELEGMMSDVNLRYKITECSHPITNCGLVSDMLEFTSLNVTLEGMREPL